MSSPEILFRGKCTDPVDGDWIYGDLRYWCNGKVAIIPRGNMKDSVCGYEVFADSVGQFTGLFDRNKLRIFVGDIVVSHTAQKSSFWEHIAKGYIVATPGKYMLQCPDGQVDIMAYPDFEIIGNIYEQHIF